MAAYRLANMRRSTSALALLILCSSLPAFCVELVWVRILSGDCDAVVWRPGVAWPSRPDSFPFEPSAVLSFATVAPGDSLPEARLEAKARLWERSLAESGRFSRATVLVTEAADDPDSRGLIVEAEAGAVPVFDGGAAYASMALPLAGGRRATVAMEGGANRASLAYRDEVFRDRPVVLEGRIIYENDLIETGTFVNNRLSAGLGFGPRLGPLGDVLFRVRGKLPLDNGAGVLLALDAELELTGLSFFGIEGLDGSLESLGSVYPGSTALRLEAESGLRLKLGAWAFACDAGLGLSSGALDSGELFRLDAGNLMLRGPEGWDRRTTGIRFARLDVRVAVLDCRLASWLSATLGPFAFAEAAKADDYQGQLEGIGGGLTMSFGSPVGVTVDLGYSLDASGEGALVFSASSKKSL
jgi:hypothetical protein